MSRSELRGLVAGCARRSRARAPRARQRRALPRAARVLLVLQRGHHPLVALDRRGRRPATRSRSGGAPSRTPPTAFTGSAGESRNGDAAGQHLRVLGGSGSNLVRYRRHRRPRRDLRPDAVPGSRCDPAAQRLTQDRLPPEIRRASRRSRRTWRLGSARRPSRGPRRGPPISTTRRVGARTGCEACSRR